MSRTRQGEPVGLALLVFAGIAVTVAAIARSLLGGMSPLRSQVASGGAFAGYGALYAIILSTVLPVAVAAGIIIWLYLQT